MTNETDDNKRWDIFENAEPIKWRLVDDSAHNVIFYVNRYNDGRQSTYKIKDDITMEEARCVIGRYTDFDTSTIDTIEEAETIIDMLIKRQYPNAVEEV